MVEAWLVMACLFFCGGHGIGAELPEPPHDQRNNAALADSITAELLPLSLAVAPNTA
jgi:hypothetical protein